MKNELSPTFKSLLCEAMNSKGFVYSKHNLKIEIDTQVVSGPKKEQAVLYSMTSFVEHQRIRKENDVPIKLSLSLRVVKDKDETWSHSNSEERAATFAKYVAWRLDYLIQHGAFERLQLAQAA